MAKFEISVEMLPESKRNMKMLTREWKRRFDAFGQQFVEDVADDTRKDISRRIPGDQKAYRDSLKTAKVTGVAGSISSYAITSVTKEESASSLQKRRDSVLIYVRVIRGSRRARVLESYNPWTQDTLPFQPPANEGLLIYRPATSSEVKFTGTQRRLQMPKIRSQLIRAGASSADPSSTKAVLGADAQGKAVADYVRLALQMEYGMGGMKAKPHWRPALSNLVSKDLPHYFTSQLTPARLKLAQAVFDPTFSAWSSWPRPVTERLSAGRLKDFAVFQSRVQPKTGFGA